MESSRRILVANQGSQGGRAPSARGPKVRCSQPHRKHAGSPGALGAGSLRTVPPPWHGQCQPQQWHTMHVGGSFRGGKGSESSSRPASTWPRPSVAHFPQVAGLNWPQLTHALSTVCARSAGNKTWGSCLSAAPLPGAEAVRVKKVPLLVRNSKGRKK